MSGPVVVMCMEGVGHMRPLAPVIECISKRGREVVVMTKPELREIAEAAGGRFVDLFAGRPLDSADSESRPVPSRFVSFAGVYGAELAEEVGALDPSLIVHDTFTVAASVVAEQLDLPRVCVHQSHAMVPSRAMEMLRDDPRVDTSSQCLAAVEKLRSKFGMEGANPFSYVDGVSPDLNLYSEPEEFLSAEERTELEPLAFFGSLAPDLQDRRPRRGSRFEGAHERPRLFASFGTVIWWYYEREAIIAFEALAEGCSRSGVELLVSLGGHELAPEARASIESRGARVVEYADQWATLQHADAFANHGGPNSVHESIYHRVPMLSYPFFWDQPALARRCEELGLALPLTREPRGTVDTDRAASLIAEATNPDSPMHEALEEARGWELRTIADRDAVVDRMLALG